MKKVKEDLNEVKEAIKKTKDDLKEVTKEKAHEKKKDIGSLSIK